MKRKLCISISGGGALGIGPLAFLCRLEQDLGKSISKISTAFAGTSTGSIIAGGLDEGYSAHDLFELYKNNLSKIFTKYSWYKRLDPKCPTYDNSNLKKILEEKFKGTVSDWKKPIFIPTTYMNGESVEKVWDLGDKTINKWFTILTSTAAPTYFDIIIDADGNSYSDGGLWANSCSDILLAGMFKQNIKDIKILNLETGMQTPNKDTGNKSLIQWASYLIGDWIARSSNSPVFECKSILGDKYVFNACPKVEKGYKMDDISDKTINKVIEIWENYYSENKKEIKEFIKL